MKTIYIVCLTNGLSYEDADYKSIRAFSTRKLAKQWIKDNPLSPSIYAKIFGYDWLSYSYNARYFIDTVKYFEE